METIEAMGPYASKQVIVGNHIGALTLGAQASDDRGTVQHGSDESLLYQLCYRKTRTELHGARRFEARKVFATKQ